MKQLFDFSRRHLETVLTVLILLGAGAYLWLNWETLLPLLQDPEALRAYVAGLGWRGPLALIAINILQIVVAPIPGYGLYFAAGYLFDWFWGGVWGTVGMLLGAMAAMWIARRIGRPFVMRMTGEARLQRWEEVTHSDSTLVWFLILLSPIGDTPYLLAGLAQVGFLKILILTTITRMPAAFGAAAVGSGAFALNWWQLLLIALVFAIPLLVFNRYRQPINDWFHRRVERQLRQE